MAVCMILSLLKLVRTFVLYSSYDFSLTDLIAQRRTVNPHDTTFQNTRTGILKIDSIIKAYDVIERL